MKYPRIRNLREDNDLTQQQIADMLYINRRTYAAYENGINSMTPETLCKIADIFHTSVDWLLGRTDEFAPYPKADKALLPRPQRTGEIFLFLVIECAECLVSHIDVELRYLLERRVHGEHGHADIDNVYAEMCDILGNRSAAALVDLAELAYLPDDIILIKELSELADELGVGIRGVGLAARAGILCDNDSPVYERGVELVMDGLECGVNSRIDIRRKALGRSENISALESLSLCEILNKELKICGGKACIADGAYLLLVGQHGDSRVARGRAVESRHERGISADPVVVAVAADKAAVKADIRDSRCGHELKLRGEEIRLRDSVFSLRSFIILSFTRSLPSSLLKGRLPTRMLSSSPFMTWEALRSPMVLSRCGSRSVMTNCGSPSLSPIDTVSFSPSALTITPWSESGTVGH